jgi:hypothetical protein
MKKLLTILFLSMFFLRLASAVSPFISTSPQGLILEYPVQDYFKVNQTYTFDIHVFNSSNGVPLSSGVNCTFHLYNSSGDHLVQLLDNSAVAYDYQFIVLNSNFSYEGLYSYVTFCNSTTAGGFISVPITVNGNGKPSPEGIVIIGFCILFLVLLSSITVLLIKAIGNIAEGDFDLMDVGYTWGLYFGLLGSYQLAEIYLGNVLISGWLSLFVTVLGLPMILIPILALFLSIFRNKKRKAEEAKQW